MTKKTKVSIRALANHIGLRVKYVNDLSPKVAGFLDPSKASRTIVVNANKSKSEHAFTVLHEIAHYLLHCRRSHRPQLPWCLKHPWKSRRISRLATKIKRYSAKVFNQECEADLWAFCALMHLGATDDIQAMIDQHPEKISLFCLCAVASIYTGIKSRLKRAFKTMFSSFNFCWKRFRYHFSDGFNARLSVL